MTKEVRSQRLMTFMQVASNQFLAPFVKWHSIIKEIAKSLDIDPEQLVNDPEKAAIFMKMMGDMNGNQQTQGPNPQQGGMGPVNGIPAGANVADTQGSGGGNIGTGNIPMPGETGFTSPNTSMSDPSKVAVFATSSRFMPRTNSSLWACKSKGKSMK